MAKAQRLADLVDADERFELWGASPSCGLVVWRPRQVSAAEARAKLRGAWVSLTVIDGETWFRSVACNPEANPELVFQRVAESVEAVSAAHV